MVTATLAFITASIYLVSTYYEKKYFTWFEILDLVVMFIFLGEFFIKLITQHPIHYLLKLSTMVDIITIIPLLWLLLPND